MREYGRRAIVGQFVAIFRAKACITARACAPTHCTDLSQVPSPVFPGRGAGAVAGGAAGQGDGPRRGCGGVGGGAGGGGGLPAPGHPVRHAGAALLRLLPPRRRQPAGPRVRRGGGGGGAGGRARAVALHQVRARPSPGLA